MKHKNLIPILIVLLLATTVSCSDTTSDNNTSDTTSTEVTDVVDVVPEKQEDIVVEPKTVNYVGSVDKYPIHMTLNFADDDITGYYSYDSQQINIDLVGTVSGSNVELLTTDGSEKFTGVLEEGRIYGDWFYQDTSLSFDVTDKTLIPQQTDDIFKQIGELNLSFSSGAGGWGTEISIFDDGSFEGVYHDSDMGDNGDKYPGGTRYYSSFTGHFSVKTKLDDHTYLLTLDNIQYANEVDTEEYADDVKYIYTTAYGLDADTEFVLCLPGKPRNDLSEQVLSWDLAYIWGGENSPNLPYYALYGVDSENAFFSN